MEYIPGGTLENLLQDPVKIQKLSWPLLIRIAHDVALALQYLHNCTPQLVHGCLTLQTILVVDLDVNADQVVKVNDISLLGNSSWWEDTVSYISIVRTLVETFVELLESSKCPESAENYVESILEMTESESEDIKSEYSYKAKLMDAIGADIVLHTMSSLQFNSMLNESNEGLVPSIRSSIPKHHVIIPKIFQRIIQMSGGHKLPDFDQICSMFTAFLNPEKTTELIRLKMGNFASQLSNDQPENSPPKRRKKVISSFDATDQVDSESEISITDNE